MYNPLLIDFLSVVNNAVVNFTLKKFNYLNCSVKFNYLTSQYVVLSKKLRILRRTLTLAKLITTRAEARSVGQQGSSSGTIITTHRFLSTWRRQSAGHAITSIRLGLSSYDATERRFLGKHLLFHFGRWPADRRRTTFSASRRRAAAERTRDGERRRGNEKGRRRNERK